VPPKERAPASAEDQARPSSRQLAWLLFHFDEQLDTDARQQRTRLCQLRDLDTARVLVGQLRALIRDRMPEGLASWIADYQSSGIAELKPSLKAYSARRRSYDRRWSCSTATA
jgi:hypothetical protein